MKRILCVDDDQEILDIYDMIFTPEGYEVKTSTFPADILNSIHDFAPHLIILDINMIKTNGLEVCKEVKSYLENRNTPIIIVSSDVSIYTAVCDFGATDILLKPFIIDELIKKVGFYLLPQAIYGRE